MNLTQSQQFALDTITQHLKQAGIILLYGSAGYAITAHKSQGSTYTNVLVDEPDFNKIQNRMNYKYNKLEYRIREKNQLRYVAYTRAKNNLYVIRN